MMIRQMIEDIDSLTCEKESNIHPFSWPNRGRLNSDRLEDRSLRPLGGVELNDESSDELDSSDDEEMKHAEAELARVVSKRRISVKKRTKQVAITDWTQIQVGMMCATYSDDEKSRVFADRFWLARIVGLDEEPEADAQEEDTEEKIYSNSNHQQNLISVHWYKYDDTSTAALSRKWTKLSFTTAWTTKPNTSNTRKRTTATNTKRNTTRNKGQKNSDSKDDDDDNYNDDDDNDDNDEDTDDADGHKEGMNQEDVNGEGAGKSGVRARFDKVRWISVIPRDKVVFAFDKLKTGGLIPPALIGKFKETFGN